MAFTKKELTIALSSEYGNPGNWGYEGELWPVGKIAEFYGCPFIQYPNGEMHVDSGSDNDPNYTKCHILLKQFALFIGFKSTNDYLDALKDLEDVKVKIRLKLEEM